MGTDGTDENGAADAGERRHADAAARGGRVMFPKSICASLNGDFSVQGEAFPNGRLPPGDPGKQVQALQV